MSWCRLSWWFGGRCYREDGASLNYFVGHVMLPSGMMVWLAFRGAQSIQQARLGLNRSVEKSRTHSTWCVCVRELTTHSFWKKNPPPYAILSFEQFGTFNWCYICHVKTKWGLHSTQIRLGFIMMGGVRSLVYVHSPVKWLRRTSWVQSPLWPPAPYGWVGVSIMWPAETAVMVSPLYHVGDSTQNYQTSVLGPVRDIA